jgi:hypothetical protein
MTLFLFYLLHQLVVLQEMEQFNNFKYDMPEVSEVLTSFFTGSEKQKPRAVKSNKKRQ